MPQLLGDVRRQGSQHDHQRLDGLPRGAGLLEVLGEVVGQHRELGDRRVVAQRVVVLADAGDGLVQQPFRVVVELGVGDPERTGLLVDDESPDALQESLRPHHVLGGPRPRLVERTHEHLVDAQRIGTVVTADVVGRHRVLEGLAHLAVLPANLLTVVEELAVLFGDLFGGHIDAARIGVGVRLDHALVEQLSVRFATRDVSEVEEDLVPEPRIQQVQHRVLDTTDVEVEATRVVLAVQCRPGPHPVRLVLLGAQGFRVGGVDVAQLVPRTARPLGHDVGVPGVGLHAVAQVEFHRHPLGGLRQRRRRLAVRVVGVEGHRRIVVDLRELHRQH